MCLISETSEPRERSELVKTRILSSIGSRVPTINSLTSSKHEGTHLKHIIMGKGLNELNKPRAQEISEVRELSSFNQFTTLLFYLQELACRGKCRKRILVNRSLVTGKKNAMSLGIKRRKQN